MTGGFLHPLKRRFRWPFKSERLNLTGGIDASFAEDLIIGLSLGVEGSDTRTPANNGRSETYGFTVAPYFTYLINDAMSVVSAVDRSRLSHEESHGAQRAITGDTNTKRLFAVGNGNWSITYDNWYLSACGGVTLLLSGLDAVIESDVPSSLDQPSGLVRSVSVVRLPTATTSGSPMQVPQ